jgi:hypothetical protein
MTLYLLGAGRLKLFGSIFSGGGCVGAGLRSQFQSVSFTDVGGFTFRCQFGARLFGVRF